MSKCICSDIINDEQVCCISGRPCEHCEYYDEEEKYYETYVD